MINNLINSRRVHAHPSLRVQASILVALVRAELPAYRSATRRAILAALQAEGYAVGIGGDNRAYVAGIGLAPPQTWIVKDGHMVAA